MTARLRSCVAAAALAAGVAWAAPASAALVDISGISVTPPGNSLTVTLGPGTVTDIAFDFDVQHFGNSWGCETLIGIEAPDGTVFSFDGGSDFGFSCDPGVHSFSGSVDIADESAAGSWTFTFNDSFDDSGTDHTYLSGSTIELVGGTLIESIPEPGTLALAGAGLLGLAWLRRRRRSA